jgi:hypothetical protein
MRCWLLPQPSGRCDQPLGQQANIEAQMGGVTVNCFFLRGQQIQ